jgi:hypothetical protein
MFYCAVLTLFFCLTACGALTISNSPRLKGVVVDAKGRPIDDVQISDVSETFKTSKIVARTDTQGTFELIPGSKKIHPIAPGCYGRDGHFLFEKSHYESTAIPYRITCAGETPPEMPDSKVVLKSKQLSKLATS